MDSYLCHQLYTFRDQLSLISQLPHSPTPPNAHPTLRERSKLRYLLAGLGLLLGVWLLKDVIATINFDEAFAIVSTLSATGIILLFLPSTLQALIDALAWQNLLPRSVPTGSILRMVRLRLAAEAVVNTVPMGSIVADPLKAWLLKQRFGISLPRGTASVLLRTFLLAHAQGVSMLLVAILGYDWMTQATAPLLPTGYLMPLVIGLSAMGVVLYTVLITAACGGSLTHRLHQLLLRVPFARIRNWLEAKEEHFLELNRELSEFGDDRAPTLWASIALYLLFWVLEGVETYIMLHLIGAKISFWDAIAIETFASYIKSVAFVIPSGIGLQDASYLTMLTTMGESGAITAAFIILKRARQVAGVLLGFLILPSYRKRMRTAAAHQD